MARSSDPRLAEVLSALEGHRPLDDREAASLERLWNELDRLEDPFSETADPVHLTSSAFVVGTRGTVLHLHRRLNIWVQPGGHVDEAERASDAALRETLEETGLQVVHPPDGPLLVHLDCHAGPRGHTHLDLRYVLLAPSAEPTPPPGESQEVRWCTFAEATTLAEPALVPALGFLEELWRAHEVSWRAIVEAMDSTGQDAVR
jgi:8-oxo-dGTP pyrophosphatase MutT (NUDIX family)